MNTTKEAVLEQNQFRTKSVEELSEFFHNLFFLNVSVTRGGVFDIDITPSFVVSVYRNANDAIIGALLLDLPAGACLAGALCDLPEDMIEEIIESRSFNDDIWGDLQEVLNICSQLFATNSGDPITLEEVYLHPNNLPQEAFEVLVSDFDPLLFRINIDGYGGGVMGVLDAQNNPVFSEMLNESVSAGVEEKSEESDLGRQEDFFSGPDSARAAQKNYFEDDEELQSVSDTPQAAPSSLPKIALGMIIGAVIGGVGVGALTSTDVRIVEVPIEVPIKEAQSSPVTEQSAPREVARQVSAPKQKYRNASDIVQILVAKEAFHMGCTTEFSGECLADEFPSYSVQLTNSYYIMRHEVTQDLYTQVMALNPSQFRSCGVDCPVENISWVQTATFANKLSKFQGLEECYSIDGFEVKWEKGVDCLGWRLPTEAEWEFAARGTKGQSEGRFAKMQNQAVEQRSERDVWVYAGGNVPTEVAWFGGFQSHGTDNLGRKVGAGQGSTHPICSKAPNDLDLCDMSGNVWEWVWNGYGLYPKTKRLVKDPIGVNSNPLKVLRGGSWLSTENELRSSYRMYAGRTVIDTMVPNYGSFGARLVRTSPAIKPKMPTE